MHGYFGRKIENLRHYKAKDTGKAQDFQLSGSKKAGRKEKVVAQACTGLRARIRQISLQIYSVLL